MHLKEGIFCFLKNYPVNPEIPFNRWELANFFPPCPSAAAWHHRVKCLHCLEAACRCGPVTGFLGFRCERFNSPAFWFLEPSSGNHTSDPQNAWTLHPECLSLYSLCSWSPAIWKQKAVRDSNLLVQSPFGTHSQMSPGVTVACLWWKVPGHFSCSCSRLGEQKLNPDRKAGRLRRAKNTLTFGVWGWLFLVQGSGFDIDLGAPEWLTELTRCVYLDKTVISVPPRHSSHSYLSSSDGLGDKTDSRSPLSGLISPSLGCWPMRGCHVWEASS